MITKKFSFVSYQI